MSWRHTHRCKRGCSGISYRTKRSFKLERPSSDGCKTGSAYERIDFTVIMPFAMMVGPQAGLQAVCTRMLARLHRVLARRLAYSHRVLVHKGPCLQAERISFASRYSFGYNIKPCQLFLRLTDRLSRYGQAMAAHPLTDFSGVYRHGVTRDPIGQGYRVAPRHGDFAAGGAVVG